MGYDRTFAHGGTVTTNRNFSLSQLLSFEILLLDYSGIAGVAQTTFSHESFLDLILLTV